MFHSKWQRTEAASWCGAELLWASAASRLREFAHLIFLAATAAKSWLQQSRPVSLNLHTGYTLPSHHTAHITECTTLLCESAEPVRPHKRTHTCCFFSWNRSISSLKSSSAFYNTRDGRQFMQATARTHTNTHTNQLHKCSTWTYQCGYRQSWHGAFKRTSLRGCILQYRGMHTCSARRITGSGSEADLVFLLSSASSISPCSLFKNLRLSINLKITAVSDTKVSKATFS